MRKTSASSAYLAPVLFLMLLVASPGLPGETALGGQKRTGPYLGQTPPGTTPAIFAPGFVSTGLDESGGTFSPDGNEFYFMVVVDDHETIAVTKQVGGTWIAPEVAPFSGRYGDGFPCYQPGGSRLFFHSNRPSASKAAYSIWFVEKTEGRWSEPKEVGPPINGPLTAVCPTVTRNGGLYFSRQFEDKSEIIFRAEFVDGKYREPERLPPQINTQKEQFHQAVSPDEECLILPLAGRADEVRPGHNFYASFRDGSGRWGDFVNLGKAINNLPTNGIASFSPDGKYFFFSAYSEPKPVEVYDRRMSYADLRELAIMNPAGYKLDIYWVDAKAIYDLKLGK